MKVNSREEEVHDEGEEGAAENEQDESLMVPRVKVAEDGSLIIDEERYAEFCTAQCVSFFMSLSQFRSRFLLFYCHLSNLFSA